MRTCATCKEEVRPQRAAGLLAGDPTERRLHHCLQRREGGGEDAAATAVAKQMLRAHEALRAQIKHLHRRREPRCGTGAVVRVL